MKPLESNEEKLSEKNELFYEKILLFAIRSGILGKKGAFLCNSTVSFVSNPVIRVLFTLSDLEHQHGIDNRQKEGIDNA